eukprot:CAMPEP_0181413742 /NCGR_PEP_ID=MMETSP1110-20121109/9134_1 /TAXON_ID=174948 /ORGANISM="Symbiodinium sp., Strain CCMP421" /LENGTH=463 /DNA_ID=CAMNT_0023536575 /DNA_START=48 /DNA_END=1439 /DNA_ORIENTATION=-
MADTEPSAAPLVQPAQKRCDCTRRCLIGSILGILVLAAVIVIVAVAAGSHHGGVSPGPAPSPPPLVSWPLRGIAYAALPCTADDACKKQLPSEDMMQQGYKAQWGASGRNDLGIIKQLGANAVRLYHSMGKGPATDHSGFLDEALKQGLNVLPGIDSDLGIYNCTEFDCYETVKKVVKTGFSLGFAKGKNWHPAVHTVIIMNEPDFFENDPKCPGKAPWCRVKAVLSGLDGLLAAEREAGILPGRVNLTTTWSFQSTDSIDGKCKKCPGYFGFQDMLAAVDDPSIAKYKPRTPVKDLAAAFDKRWINGLNVQAPWSFVHDTISKNYGPFGNRPWFIGEFGALSQPHSAIQSDIQAMAELANSSDPFVGATIFQFQTAYWKGGSEMSFGLFGLGKEKVADTENVCKQNGECAKWPVYCLNANLTWLPASQAERASAVAKAWGGKVTGTCRNTTVFAETVAEIVL